MTKRRFNPDWLNSRIEAGWSVMDMAHADNCAVGTIQYHIDQRSDYDSEDVPTTPLCDRFTAEGQRASQQWQEEYEERQRKEAMYETDTPPTTEASKLGDFA